LGELHENIGGIVNYYRGVSFNFSFGLTSSTLALVCSSNSFKTAFYTLSTQNPDLCKFTLSSLL
jgi:hypothetical protein